MMRLYLFVFLLPGLPVSGQEAGEEGRGVEPRWQNEYDESFLFACSSRYSISAIHSIHHNHHEDRLWDFECQYTFDSEPHCSWSGYVNGFDAPFTFTCPSNYVLSGMNSYHDNHHEDRRWNFLCCSVSDYCNSNCRWTPYVNYFDEQFSWYVPDQHVLVGTSSYHENKHEDRRWQYLHCTRTSC